jgi:multiple sugar transport system permease protein
VTALALWRSALAGAASRVILLLPLALPPVVVGVLWRLIFTPNGGLIDAIRRIVAPGTDPIAFLSDPALAIVAIALADIWEWAPLVTILVFAALLGIDREVMEAASLDGAHGLRLLREIAVPAVLGTIAATFVIRLVLALKVFDLVNVMTKGGPGDASAVPAWLVWKAAIEQFDVGRGAAITLLLAVVVTLITLPPILIARRSHG